MADGEALSPMAENLYVALSSICAGQPVEVVTDAVLGVVVSAMVARAKVLQMTEQDIMMMIAQFAGDLATNVLANRHAGPEDMLPANPVVSTQ